MKIKFNNLETSLPVIKVSFDGGGTYVEYKVNDVKAKGGIEFSEKQCNDLSKIIIKGKVKTLKNLDSEVTELNSVLSPVVSYVNDTIPSKTTTYSSEFIKEKIDELNVKIDEENVLSKKIFLNGISVEKALNIPTTIPENPKDGDIWIV